jgi:hypothetical protein
VYGWMLASLKGPPPPSPPRKGEGRSVRHSLAFSREEP